MAVQQGVDMLPDAGNAAPVQVGALVNRVEDVLGQHGLTEAELCQKLNRLKRRSSDGELLTIHEQIIAKLRAGDRLSPVRLQHFTACLDDVFGRPDPAVRPNLAKRLQSALRKVPLFWIIATAMALLALSLYWWSDKAYQDRFAGVAGILGTVIATITVFAVRRK